MTPQTNQVLWLELGRYYFDTPKYHSNAMRFIGNGEQVTLPSVARNAASSPEWPPEHLDF